MEQCKTCGKLMDASRGQTQCYACRAAEAASDEAPERDRASLPDEQPDEIDYLAGAEPCVRCRKHLAMVDSEFCLACQLELLSLLGDAAHELFQTPPPPPKPPVSSAVSLMNDVEGKRDRTPTSRVRVVGGVKIK